MSDGLADHRPMLGKVASYHPKLQRLLVQSSLCVMSGEQAGLGRRNLWEFVFERCSDAAMQLVALTTQERGVGSVLHKCMFEQVSGVRRYALSKQQTCLNEAINGRFEFRFTLGDHRCQQRMRELPPNDRSDLCDLFGRS